MSAQTHEAEAETRDLRAIFAQGASDNLGNGLRHGLFEKVFIVVLVLSFAECAGCDLAVRTSKGIGCRPL